MHCYDTYVKLLTDISRKRINKIKQKTGNEVIQYSLYIYIYIYIHCLLTAEHGSINWNIEE